MGRKAEKTRRLAAKAKKQSGQDSSDPSITPGTLPAPLPAALPAPLPAALPASPLASPCSETLAIPEIGARTNADAHTAAKTSKGPATKERKGPHVVTSDRVTRMRPCGTSAATMGPSQENTGPGLSEPQEILTGVGKASDGSDQPRTLQKSSHAIKMLLQQIISDENSEGDIAIDSNELEGESDNKYNWDNDGYRDGKDCSDDCSDDCSEVVETVARKKTDKSVGPQVRRKQVKVVEAQVDESESSECDKNGEFDSLSYSCLPHTLSAWSQRHLHS